MNQQETQYFAKHWQMNWDNKKYSGWALLDKLKETDQILDIGCGKNPLKEKLGDRVYGIDPAFDQADEKITWEDYTPHKKFNVFLCLGSLNFGTDKEKSHDYMTLDDARKNIDNGVFPAGSMGPKVEAICLALESIEGLKAIICQPGQAISALRGDTGTTFVN